MPHSPLLLRYILVAGLLLQIVACAGISERDCTNPDWYMTGFEDGAAGYSSSRLQHHLDACADAGEAPDEDAWRAGHEDGLTHFCSPAGGLAEGSRGRIRSKVCPAQLADGFDEGYRLGREIYETNQELNRIEGEIRALEARASGGPVNAVLSDSNDARIRQLEREYDQLVRELRLLELRADRLERE